MSVAFWPVQGVYAVGRHIWWRDSFLPTGGAETRPWQGRPLVCTGEGCVVRAGVTAGHQPCLHHVHWHEGGAWLLSPLPHQTQRHSLSAMVCKVENHSH